MLLGFGSILHEYVRGCHDAFYYNIPNIDVRSIVSVIGYENSNLIYKSCDIRSIDNEMQSNYW
jgi:hypothetical protein